MKFKKLFSILLLVFVVLVSVQPTFAQAGPIQWTYYDVATSDNNCRNSKLITNFTPTSAFISEDSGGERSYCYGQVWGETYVENISQVTFNWYYLLEDPYCSVEMHVITDSPYSTDFYFNDDTYSKEDFSDGGVHTVQLPPNYTGKVYFYISVDVGSWPSPRTAWAGFENITFQ
ncbi:hypothetical protein [Paenibacillus sp. OAS669]|uniref:hypothetical protein n=1 Tax=Paenibacillus sp. OAS669 TaxID=2663821 RepID=UPI00178B3E1E|nr:hypothetical protein [Paenibacillus sp. OAS669]MBE1441611.1 hypothetical protein [Paenibacillus sp. OAS669]